MTTPKAKKTPAKKAKQEGPEKIETYNDLYMFQRGLQRAERVGNKFSHAVSKCLRHANNEIEDLEKVIEQNDHMKAYNKKVEDLNREYALKDDEGEFMLRDTVIQGEKAKVYRIPGKSDPTSKFGKALQKIKDSVVQVPKDEEDKKSKEMIDHPDGRTYQVELDAHQEKVDDYNEFLKGKFSYEPARMIDLVDVPDAAGPVMDAIIFMIKEPKD